MNSAAISNKTVWTKNFGKGQADIFATCLTEEDMSNAMSKNFTPKQLLVLAKGLGSIPLLQSNCALHSRDHVLSNQVNWDQAEPLKNFDFSVASFWFVPPGATKEYDALPEPFDDANELQEFMNSWGLEFAGQ